MRYVITLLGIAITSLPTAIAQEIIVTTTSSSDNFGRTVAAAGDVDGDGIPDLLVVTPGASVSLQGSTRVVRLPSGAQIAQYSGGSYGQYPTEVSTAAIGNFDVDNDGKVDLALSEFPVKSVRVIDAATGALHFQMGKTLGSYFTSPGYGNAMAVAGDVDLDGFVDLVVADRFGGQVSSGITPGYGTVDLRSGLNGTPLHSELGTTMKTFGFAVAAAGDVDTDGHPDYAYSFLLNSGSGTNQDTVIVRSGAAYGVLRTYAPAPTDGGFGVSLSGGFDLDSDGVGDLVIGQCEMTDVVFGNFTGSATAHSNKLGTLLYRATGPFTQYDLYGIAVAGGADLNGDGLGDIAVGVPQIAGSSVGTPRVELRNGVTGVLFGEIDGAIGIGSSLAVLGDVDHDGRSDLAVGSPNSKSATVYHVCSGEVATIGAGCPGLSGATPTLTATGCANAGSKLSLVVSAGLPGAPGVLVIGVHQISSPLPHGCTFLTSPVVIVPFTLAAGGPQAGSYAQQSTLAPNLPPLVAFLQAFTQDGWVQGTSALRVTVH